MNPGKILQALALFLSIYALLYFLVELLSLPALLADTLQALGLEREGNVLYCGEVGWISAPECTGIFALALWLSLAFTFRIPRRALLLGALIAYISDLLRVLLSVYIGCLLQSAIPHILLWLLPPAMVLILWHYFYVRA